MVKLANFKGNRIINYQSKFALTQINSLTGGFNSGELVIISAKPKIGKTTLALDLLYDFNWQGFKTLFISCEMNTSELLRRLNKIDSGMDKSYLNKELIFVEDENGIDLEMIENDIKNSRPDLIFIDYIQLLKGKLKINSKKLKELARKYNLPIICLAQRNRNTVQVEKWIEQDADQIWFIDYERTLENICWEENNESIDIYKIDIVKNRKGKIGSILTKAIKSYFWFDDFNPEIDDPNWKENVEKEKELKELENFEKRSQLKNRWRKYLVDKLNKKDYNKEYKVIIGNMIV